MGTALYLSDSESLQRREGCKVLQGSDGLCPKDTPETWRTEARDAFETIGGSALELAFSNNHLEYEMPYLTGLDRSKSRLNRLETLNIQETFQQTIQGEGFFTGSPCDFIRLWGCPVGCRWCDQGFAAEKAYGAELPRNRREIGDLIDELKSPLVVISGGEPLAQKNVSLLAREILRTGRKVAIETSGAVWADDLPRQAWVTLSPKEHVVQRAAARVDERFWARANEFKIVIESGNEVDFYLESIRGKDAYLYLQPEWEQRAKTIPIALDMLKRYPDASLSLQSHKYIGVQ